jgi:hypothetical protein
MKGEIVKTIARRPSLRVPYAMAILLLCCSLSLSGFAQESKWTEEHARQWYANQPFLVGANFLPSNAVNELEMWQADTFDHREIDCEFGWAEQLGMNTMRVFLHNLLWDQDPSGFQKRIDRFLSIAPAIISGRSSCFSIPAGIQIQSSVYSVRRFLACITRAGCRPRARPCSQILRNIRA